MNQSQAISFHASKLAKLLGPKRVASTHATHFREAGRKGGKIARANSICPWCAAILIRKVDRVAHAQYCPERPADADPSVFK